MRLSWMVINRAVCVREALGLSVRAGSRPGRRKSLLAVASVVATVAAGTPAAALAAPRVPPAASPTGTSTASAAGITKLVTLVTGDVVSVATTSDGRQLATVARQTTAGPGSVFQTFTLGTDMYVVPESAVPYLGSTLDMSLFDVTKLTASGTADPAVQVTYRTASAPQAIPGITITHRSGTSAQGVVTSATGHAFGVALAAQWRADHAAATHTTGLFASVARISAPASATGAPTTAAPATPATGAPATQSAQPGFVQSTLTVNGIDATGNPDTGDVVLITNVDDESKYGANSEFIDGVAKVSVPNGHYSAICAFFGANNTMRWVALPQFTVAGPKTTIRLDARNATSAVTVTTPKPASLVENASGIGRTDKLGHTSDYEILGSQTYFVQPTTKPVTIGQLHYSYYVREFAADGSYTYDLDFPSEGSIPADQNYAPQPSDLATVDSKYPASHAGINTRDARFSVLPWQSSVAAFTVPITIPTERTEYYTSYPDSGLTWLGHYYQVFTFVPFVLAGEEYSGFLSYQRGASYTTTWGGTPAGPRLFQEPDPFQNGTLCAACLNGTTLSLYGYPFGDTSPDHLGIPGILGDTEATSYTVSADGVPVAQGGSLLHSPCRDGFLFCQTSVTMPSSAQSYEIDYDTSRSSADFLLSTAAQTRWTVPATVPTGSLPAGWECDEIGSTSCSVVPLITNSYDLPVSMLGQLPAGAVSGRLDLGHLGGMNIGFSSVQVNVSFDSGQTWQPVTVTDLGSGQFELDFTVPAATSTDGYGALQVSASDAAGGTFDQTIQHAFAVGS